MSSLQEKVADFFATFPSGAGEGWLSGFFGVTRAEVATACTALGAVRFESSRKGSAEGSGPAAPVEIGVEWRKPAPAGAARVMAGAVEVEETVEESEQWER